MAFDIEAKIREEQMGVYEGRLYNASRRNINLFCELVMRDQQTGQGFTQAPIHIEMQQHIDWCLQNGFYAGILSHWASGKSNQVIARILDMIGKDPNKRIKIVCNTDEFAMKRVSAIRDYLDKSEEYKKIYPEVVPEMGREKWTEHRLNVKRNTYGATDYSIEAGGIFSAAISGRCDVLIGDDICDFKNSKVSPTIRQKVIEAWKNDWLSRLEPNGFVLYTATPWHKRDCTHDQMESKKFAWKIFEVTKDLEKLKVTKKYWKITK